MRCLVIIIAGICVGVASFGVRDDRVTHGAATHELYGEMLQPPVTDEEMAIKRAERLNRLAHEVHASLDAAVSGSTLSHDDLNRGL